MPLSPRPPQHSPPQQYLRFGVIPLKFIKGYIGLYKVIQGLGFNGLFIEWLSSLWSKVWV